MNILAVAIILLISLLESATYLGFVAVHFHVPSVAIYLASFILLAYLPVHKRLGDSSRSHFLLIYTGTLSSLYVFLDFAESLHYPNFVYSHWHLNLSGLEIAVSLAILCYCLTSAVNNSYLERIKRGLLGVLVFVVVFNVAHLLPVLYVSLSPLLRDPFASYDTKMTLSYPGFYPAMQQILQLTPPDSSIVIPPQAAPWVTEGNSALVRRFLYPRQILTWDQFPGVSHHALYLLIARGSWPSDGTYPPGWPKVVIPAETIWQFDLDHHAAIHYSRDYDPSQDPWDWGLIKVKDD